MVTASYFRQQANLVMAEAAKAKDPVLAARLRERAQEYLLLAEAMESSSEPPSPEEQPQQRQQHQAKKDADEE
jgi:hypothetical protein